MMTTLTPRLIWILLAMVSAFIALVSLLLTPWLGLEPCHLCIFQRLLFMLLALLAGLAAWVGRPGVPRLIANLPVTGFLLLAALGSGVAAWQSWLQLQPPTDSITCVGAQPGLIERLVEWLGQEVPSLFLATGFCEDAQLSILGLSLANWAWIAFTLSLAGAVWLLWRGRRSARQQG